MSAPSRFSRVGPVIGLITLGLAVAGVCTLAGTWQWQRFEQKRLSNSELRAAAERAAVPVDELLAPGRAVDDTLRLRTVEATGRYDVAAEVLVRQRTVGNRSGFLVVTPLRTDSGGTLVVVRGFVPATGAATETPTVPAAAGGTVRITGRLQPSESGGLGADLPAGQVSHVDVPALAERLGRPTYGGYVELVSSEPPETALVPLPAPDLGNPAGGAFTGQHLAYVVQWFLFALLALGGPVILLRLDRRSREREHDTTEREPAATG